MPRPKKQPYELNIEDLKPHQLPSGSWQVRGRWRRWSGEPVTAYGSGKTKGQARADLRKKLEADRAGHIKDGLDITIAGAYTRYFAHVAIVGKPGVTTLRQRRQRMNNHVIPRVGNIPLAQFTTGRANQLLDDLEGECSWSVARNVRNDLAAVLRFAVGRDWIRANPMREARTIDEPDAKPVIFDQPMCDRVRSALVEFENSDGRRKKTPLSLIWDLMLLTGCRISEIIALHWNDLYLVDELPYVRIWRSATPEEGLRKYRKSGTKPISVKLTPELTLRLKDHRQSTPGDLVFPARGGKIRDQRNLRKSFAKAMEYAGIRHREVIGASFRFHSMRRTRITNVYYEHGEGAAVAIGGHADARQLRSYVEAREKVLDYD